MVIWQCNACARGQILRGAAPRRSGAVQKWRKATRRALLLWCSQACHELYSQGSNTSRGRAYERASARPGGKGGSAFAPLLEHAVDVRVLDDSELDGVGSTSAGSGGSVRGEDGSSFGHRLIAQKANSIAPKGRCTARARVRWKRRRRRRLVFFAIGANVGAGAGAGGGAGIGTLVGRDDCEGSREGAGIRTLAGTGIGRKEPPVASARPTARPTSRTSRRPQNRPRRQLSRRSADDVAAASDASRRRSAAARATISSANWLDAIGALRMPVTARAVPADLECRAIRGVVSSNATALAIGQGRE